MNHKKLSFKDLQKRAARIEKNRKTYTIKDLEDLRRSRELDNSTNVPVHDTNRRIFTLRDLENLERSRALQHNSNMNVYDFLKT